MRSETLMFFMWLAGSLAIVSLAAALFVILSEDE